MPLSASTLTRLATRFAKKKLFDISDSMAIAAACSRRGDIFGREIWIDTAIEKMALHKIPVPSVIHASCLRDLAV